MALVEQGVLDLDVPFSTYWTPWKKYRDKKDLTLREILAHQAGLTPYIVFLNEVLRSNKHRGPQLKKRFVRAHSSKRFSLQWLTKTSTFTGIFPVKMFRKINRDLKYLKKRPTPTQALAFLIFPSLIEQLTGDRLSRVLAQPFLRSIGRRQFRVFTYPKTARQKGGAYGKR